MSYLDHGHVILVLVLRIFISKCVAGVRGKGDWSLSPTITFTLALLLAILLFLPKASLPLPV